MDMNTVFKITAAVAGTAAVTALANEVKKVSTNGDGIKRAFAQGAIAVRNFAAVAGTAGAAVAAFALKQVDLADNLNDISQRTGVAVSELSKYAVAAGNSGTSVEALGTSFSKLNKNLVEAKDGTGATASALKAMGISIKDSSGNLKNADQITGEVADRFKDFPDGPQKAALAMAVFGKSGADLIPMLNMGSEAIKEFSVDIDQDFASASDGFNDQLGLMRAQATNFGIAVAKQMLPALSDGVTEMTKMFDLKDEANTFGKVVSDALRGIVIVGAGVVAIIKNVITMIKGMGQAAYASYLMVKGTLGSDESWQQGKAMMADAISGTGQDLGANFQTMLQTMQEQAGRSNLFRTEAGQQYLDQQKAANAQASKPTTPASVLKDMAGFSGAGTADKAAAASERAAKAAAEWIAKQRESIETLRLEGQTIGMTTNQIEQMKDARDIMTEAAEKAANMTGASKDAFLREAEAIAATRKEIIQFNYEQSRTFGAGAASFLTKYAEDASNTAEQVKTVFNNAFKGADDALVEFTTTGKLNFRSFAQSLIQDLIRIQIQRSILGPLSSWLGGMFGGGGGASVSVSGGTAFANGGIMTGRGPVPLRAYAAGGVANSPQMALFGEGSMPEAYVPLPDGRSIPVTMKGGGGQQNNVSVTINMASGQESNSSSGRDASKLGAMVASTVKSMLIREKQPGGLLWEGA